MINDHKAVIQAATKNLAEICLQNYGVFHKYTDKDLEHVTLIFAHFLMDAMWQTNQDLSIDKRGELVLATGEAIRELIRAATGKDMHEIVKKGE